MLELDRFVLMQERGPVDARSVVAAEVLDDEDAGVLENPGVPTRDRLVVLYLLTGEET